MLPQAPHSSPNTYFSHWLAAFYVSVLSVLRLILFVDGTGVRAKESVHVADNLQKDLNYLCSASEFQSIIPCHQPLTKSVSLNPMSRKGYMVLVPTPGKTPLSDRCKMNRQRCRCEIITGTGESDTVCEQTIRQGVVRDGLRGWLSRLQVSGKEVTC